MFKIIYSIQQKCMEFIGRHRNGESMPIYMFHHITDYPKDNEKRLNIKVNEFISFINSLKSDGVKFVAPFVLNQSFGQNKCILTFDDGHKDAFLNAIPVLEMKKIPYIYFVSPGFVGKEGYISKNDLLFLKASKFCTLGAHGLNHRAFRFLSRQDKAYELSRRKHEIVLGCNIEDFAFPYGSLYAVDNQSICMARKEYKRVYSTFNYRANVTDNNTLFPRISITSVLING